MLSPFQKKIAATALTCAALSFIAIFIVAIFGIISLALGKFATVIWPLAFAGILSFIFKPAVDFLSAKAKVSANAATAIVFLTLAIGFCAVILLLLPILITQIQGLANALPQLLNSALNYVGSHYPDLKQELLSKIDLNNLSKDTLGAISGGALKVLKTVASATGGAIAAASCVAAFAAAPIYLFYLLSSKFDGFGAMSRNLAFLPQGLREDIVFLSREFVSILSAFFRGQLLIAFIMGILLGLGFSLAGLKFGFLIGFFAGVLNIIPYFGTMIGLGAALPMAFFQDGGGVILLAICMGVFVAVQMLEGYFLTPKIMGNNTGLHPMAIIFSVFFWGIALDGLLGMMLAIPLSAFIVVFWRLLLSKYLNTKPVCAEAAQEDKVARAQTQGERVNENI